MKYVTAFIAGAGCVYTVFAVLIWLINLITKS
jgi:hypothetical protein